MNWNVLFDQIDNIVWLLLAVAIFVIAKYCEIPALNTVAGACLIKMREPNGVVVVPRSRKK